MENPAVCLKADTLKSLINNPLGEVVLDRLPDSQAGLWGPNIVGYRPIHLKKSSLIWAKKPGGLNHPLKGAP